MVTGNRCSAQYVKGGAGIFVPLVAELVKNDD
jgi:hypothetical protein